MTDTISKTPFEGTPKQERELRDFLAELKKDHGHDALMPALQKAQNIYGYLPIEVQKIISEDLEIFLEEVYGVATFYSQFTLEPKGEYNVQVCMGTACYVQGAGALLEELVKQLDIKEGERTEDGKFSLEATRCIGACGLAPLITVNEDVYGRIGKEDIKEILAKY